MEKLSRDINLLENSVAKYIYIKYIQDRLIVPNAEADENTKSQPISEKNKSSYSNSANSSSEGDESLKRKEIIPKIIDMLAYNIYRKNVFYQSRKCFTLDQKAIIREDLQSMEIADTAYDKNPDKFQVSDYELPPDALRCSFIRKYHHRYYRCRNIIMNKDSDICKKHKTHENIYYDNYNDLLKQIIN